MQSVREMHVDISIGTTCLFSAIVPHPSAGAGGVSSFVLLVVSSAVAENGEALFETFEETACSGLNPPLPCS